MEYAKILGQKLVLNNGVTLKNRFMKSAMSEVLGSNDYAPTKRHQKLYQTWAEGGTGLLMTGNIMVDMRYIGEPGNVVVEDETHLEQLQQWAEVATASGAQLWVQINHPGKQIPNILCKQPVAPSAIPLKLPMFNKPRALREDEIWDIVKRFGNVAKITKKAGFTGVQIHGAHGYLVSQFLSPYHNQRQDQWGGSLENRMRFLLEVYKSIRNAVGDEFPVSVKLNSADFQRGGFTEEESLEVIRTISDLGMNLVEISGGTYEAPAMTGAKEKQSTIEREAYFLEFADKVRQHTQVHIAVTGGFRSAKGMAEAIESGKVDLVGIARPLTIDPDLPARILNGEDFRSTIPKKISTGIKMLDMTGMLDITWYEHQIALLADGKKPNPKFGAWGALFSTLWHMNWRNLQRRRAKS